MKKIIGFIRLEIESGKATPSPPVGPALGLRGVNIMLFCKEFNNECRSRGIKDGIPLPTLITIFEDKTCSFRINVPSTTFFIKNNLNIKKGLSKPGKEHPIQMHITSIYEIAKIKTEKSALSLKSVCNSIIGSAKSMGIRIIYT